MKKRIIVSVTNDLVNDQRIERVCSTLLELDFDIVLIGRNLKNRQTIVRPYKIIRLNLLFNKGFLFYAEYNIRLFIKLLFLKKDVLLSNDLDTLLPNFLISKIFKTNLVYDSHELFTEVPELIKRPFVRNFWLKIEQIILPKIKNCYTVSESIANHYNSIYHTKFEVIKNISKKKNKINLGKFPFNTDNKNVILYQGALNKGRGLELMIDSMKYLNDSIFAIIGSGYLESNLRKKVLSLELSEKIKFIENLHPTKLQQLTGLASIGISLEEDLGFSYRYALPNKLFDYIQSRIPVLVSNLPEMKRIITKYQVGEIVTNRNPKALANQIEQFLQKKNSFNKNLELASNELNWENESKKLKSFYNNLK